MCGMESNCGICIVSVGLCSPVKCVSTSRTESRSPTHETWNHFTDQITTTGFTSSRTGYNIQTQLIIEADGRSRIEIRESSKTSMFQQSAILLIQQIETTEVQKGRLNHHSHRLASMLWLHYCAATKTPLSGHLLIEVVFASLTDLRTSVTSRSISRFSPAPLSTVVISKSYSMFVPVCQSE